MSRKNSQNNTLYLVDTNLLVTRYFFALDEFFNSDGINVNAVVAVLKVLLDLQKKGTVICLFDKCRNNFRKQICPNYKINRISLDPNLYLQTSILIEFLESINFNVDYSDIYEADDLIGSYAQIKDYKKIIYSADKDLIQLISEDILLYNPFKKIYYDAEYCLSKYQVKIDQFALFLALCGDSSDNIKGINKVGPKTAAKIINSEFPIHTWQEKFPKYDFSSLDDQLKLVTIKKDIELKQISHKYINEFEDLCRTYFNMNLF